MSVIGTLLLTAAARGHDPDQPALPSLRVTGEAVVYAQPDQVELDVAVITTSRKAEDAAEQNAERVAEVLEALRDALGKAGEVRTIGYSVSPNYRYPKEGGEPQVTGYTAHNTVRVRTGRLELVGELIDASLEAGANQVQRLAFSLKDETAVRGKALAEAATRARAMADQLAAALGQTITGVLLAEQTGGPVQPLLMRAERAMVRDAAATPIEPGTIEVRESVTVTFGIAIKK